MKHSDIVKLFKEISAELLYVLQTDRAGDIVDNGYGVEFSLREFTVIHRGELSEEQQHQIYKWEMNNDRIGCFDSERCEPDERAFINELFAVDDYNVVWSAGKETEGNE